MGGVTWQQVTPLRHGCIHMCP